jgi:hypothetical protein
MNKHLNKIIHSYLENKLIFEEELFFKTEEILKDTNDWICYNNYIRLNDYRSYLLLIKTQISKKYKIGIQPPYWFIKKIW